MSDGQRDPRVDPREGDVLPYRYGGSVRVVRVIDDYMEVEILQPITRYWDFQCWRDEFRERKPA